MRVFTSRSLAILQGAFAFLTLEVARALGNHRVKKIIGKDMARRDYGGLRGYQVVLAPLLYTVLYG